MTEFDPAFYSQKYLHGRLGRYPFLLRAHHSIKKIRARAGGEWVAPDEKTYIQSLEKKFGSLPANFDAAFYLEQHSDLQRVFRFGWQAAEHFLRHGRSEGRAYKRDAVVGATDDPRTQLEPWRKHFIACEFIALNPEMTRSVSTYDEAIEVFLEHGVDRIAPISLHARFDPQFYALRYEDVAALTPAEAYRHWLNFGAAEGRFVSEADLLSRGLIGKEVFPAAFDWRKYLLDFPLIQPKTRWVALAHLLEKGFEEGRRLPLVNGEDEAYLFECVADYLSAKRRIGAAIKAMRIAIAKAPDAGRLHHKLGDYLTESGSLSEAFGEYKRALDAGHQYVWTYIHLARHEARRENYDAAYAYLLSCKAEFAGLRPWRDTVVEIIDSHFNVALVEARGLFKSNLSREAEDRLEAALRRIWLAINEFDDLPPALALPGAGHVVMFSLMSVPQCRHYRVEQRLEQFAKLETPVKAFGGAEPKQALEALVGARALIVYREPATPDVMRLIAHAKAMGVRAFYEIDDLIFDFAHYPEPLEHYGSQVAPDEYVGLQCGVVLYRFAMSLCHDGLTSTEQLASHIARIVENKTCHYIPNGLDSRNAFFLNMRSAPRGEKTLNIFYGSGTRTHNRNFRESIAPSLAKVMRARANVRLVVVGYLDIDGPLAEFDDRIIRLGFCANIDEYWSLLSFMDINVAVLTPGEMNDCKSEIKWLEAAALAIPSIVSVSKTYERTLRDRVDALFAQSHADWERALFELVDDPAMRRRIGDGAKARAGDYFSLEANARRLAKVFAPLMEARQPQKKKLRALIVNVFFPPQIYGGATRVVRDGVDDLRDRYGSECEVAIFTTDFGARLGSSGVGGYGDVPVFRYSPSVASGAALDVENADVEAHFASVLEAWRPDVVHIHCVQFLSGSVATACQQRNIPYIVTAHDCWWLSRWQFFVDDHGLPKPAAFGLGEHLDDSQNAFATLAAQRRRLDFLSKAFAVTAVSGKFAQLYAGYIGRDVVVTENGLSRSFVRRAGAEQCGANRRVRIGHVGGLDRQKGAFLFEIALRQGRFDRIEAVVVDHDKDSGYRLETIWGETKVTIRGKCPPDDVSSLYASLDVVVAPSIWPESYGLVAREALAAGLWVIASDLGAMGDDVVEGVNGFKIDIRNAEALQTTLGDINADPAHYTQSPSHAFAPRPVSAQTDQFVALYREAARAGGSDEAESAERHASPLRQDEPEEASSAVRPLLRRGERRLAFWRS